MPLFSDDERAQVGICYKEKGQGEAIRLGLSLVGPKMADLVAQADLYAAEGPLEVYCWRGGMRSQSVAWLLQTAGHAVKRWEGGYKAYRGRVLDSWCGDHTWVVLSGLTGSGKTEILRQWPRRPRSWTGRLGPPQRDPLLGTWGRRSAHQRAI